ncbi:RiPP maturation radical SAM C-methyltransferase [Bradyrhizobium cytisi]|uniref:RiPP maturation radical SAM protein 1 n=1 Tax=Bradyrhizobium cytisi TaxID=515489 RepID=A0A5S4VZ40_9BRAD|nr:RiPP maturation radical SAM C-methyltransferase [Bradyrhizobium cytisi]TYL71017.1 RiPP maturation radical SAM protein 1 [Bradyrhizobium cytisi]
MLTDHRDVVLGVMPFGALHTPSLGVGLLHGLLMNAGRSVKTCYFTFEFAKLIGLRTYERISDGEPSRQDLLGEWIFSGNLFDQDRRSVEQYICKILKGADSDHALKRSGCEKITDREIEDLLRIRSLTAQFLEDCAIRILSYSPKIVGLTSMFQEHTAVLSLAKRLKVLDERIVTVVGGANCDGEMGAQTLKSFPFLDAVVSGEADETFCQMVEAFIHARYSDLAQLPGIHFRSRPSVDSPPQIHLSSSQSVVENLDKVPFPNFDDFFSAAKADYDANAGLYVTFETSRGCWWGEKQHCTFCGLNGSSMNFRSKSPDRALSEVTFLANKYQTRNFAAADNIIDYRYFRTLLPMMIERGIDLNLAYEVKANLKKDEICLLKKCGIEHIQPGVESFSTPTLKMMKKGVTGVQNIQLLKWCREIGVEANWGILWGFPGEDPAEYERMARLVPLLTHLQPPGGVGRIRLDRFSPNFSSARKYGFSNVAPVPSYSHVYDLPEEDVRNLAYFFRFDYGDNRDVDQYVHSLKEAVTKWQHEAWSSGLYGLWTSASVMVVDLRSCSAEDVVDYRGLEMEVLRSCERAATIGEIESEVLASGGYSESDLEIALSLLENRKLLIHMDQKYLSLLIDFSKFAPSIAVERIIAGMGRRDATGGKLPPFGINEPEHVSGTSV